GERQAAQAQHLRRAERGRRQRSAKVQAASARIGGARNFASKISEGTGLLKRKPCISSHLSRRSRRDCSAVSTPSATTFSLSACARLMMVETSDRPGASEVMSITKERSIFRESTGSLAR